ncbi:MAG TPA: DUF881 domain-containing protein [Clostridiales bacterium]|nr:DUF881 domain-containing protein [Clostridiales bacterium]
MKIARNIAITVVCIILGVMVAWQYKSINYNQNAMSYQNKRAEGLMEEVIRLQKNNADLRTQLQKLQNDVRLYESAKAGSDEASKTLLEQLKTARIFAGFYDVKGKGIIITVESNIYTVLEDDILALVNELRAAGAQAISVNDERITAMTEIRDAPPYTMINKVPVTAPFTIKAIGDPEQLENSLKMISGVVENLQEFLKITIKKSDDISIPKVREDGSVIKIDLLNPVSQ